MMHKFMMWFSGFLKCRIIAINGNPYLERYYLGTIFGKRLFIHRFMSSDPDRGLHDHPWRWALSFILAGGYNELQLKENDQVVLTKRRAPTINHFTGEAFHRVLLPTELQGRTWTLFIHGDRDRNWGFLEYSNEGAGYIETHKFMRADTKLERKKNEHWWQRADTKTGKQLRGE